MNELMGQRVWALAPNAVEQVLTQAAQPSAGPFPFANRRDAQPPYAVQRGVAVINVRGVLTKRGGFWTLGYEQIRTAMEVALSDSAVRSIMLNVDSPGGSIDGVKLLADWIASVRDRKPMCAYADGSAMSAAFWLAAATGCIYAPKTAEVGSIGVVMQHLDWSRANERRGINVTYVHSGKWKVAGNPDSPLSDKDQAYLQEQCDTLYAMFTEDVATALSLDVEAVSDWAEGRIFFAEKARDLGLVSGITAGREELIEQLAKEASPMNRLELEKQHPDLFAEVQGEARKEGEESGRQAAFEAAGAIVKAVAGEEAAERFTALSAAGVTGAQLEALAPLMGAKAPQEPSADDAEQASRKQILNALHEQSPSPVHHAGGQHVPDTPDEKRAACLERMKGIPRR
ncbi:S49 family peptidase [Desulfobaculum senezii]